MFNNQWSYDGFLDKMSSPSFDVNAYVYVPVNEENLRKENHRIVFETISNNIFIDPQPDKHNIHSDDKVFSDILVVLQKVMKNNSVTRNRRKINGVICYCYSLGNLKGTRVFNEVLAALYQDYENTFVDRFEERYSVYSA